MPNNPNPAVPVPSGRIRNFKFGGTFAPGQPRPIGVGNPDIVPASTVAGYNAPVATAMPGVPAGPLNPNAPPTEGTPAGGLGFPSKYTPKPYQVVTKSLTAADVVPDVRLNAGNIFWVLDGTNITDRVNVQFNVDGTGYQPAIPVGPGFYISGFPFLSFQLINLAAQSTDTLTIVILADEPNDRIDVQNEA